MKSAYKHCGEQKKSHIRPSDEMSMKNVNQSNRIINKQINGSPKAKEDWRQSQLLLHV
jgi:hypothetical protein